MILVDTGPFIALFDPLDPHHERSVEILKTVTEPLVTSLPVLTEAFHLLGPGSRAASSLRRFITRGGVNLFTLDLDRLKRAFALMDTYADHPMDLADASLVVAGEYLDANKVFTVDRRDFESYRMVKGHSLQPFQILF